MPLEEEKAKLPTEIQKLLGYQGQTVSVEHFDDFIKKITNGLVSKPLPFTQAQIEETVSSLLDRGMDMLSEQETDGLVNRALSQRYGEKLTNIMQSFVKDSVPHYKNIRPRFRYEIEINRRFSFGNIAIDAEKYFRLTEDLSYQKLILEDCFEENFWIAFVQDLDKLDDSLKDETFLFSENLRMDPKDMQMLLELPDAEQMEFFRKNMRTRLNLNGKVLQPTTLVIKESGIYANYRADEMLITDERKTLDVHLAFSIPHRKTSSYFFASISDPTYSPHIHFVYPEDEINVEMIPFMNRSTTAADTKIFDGLRELSFEDEWVLPMSGAVFVITLQNES